MEVTTYLACKLIDIGYIKSLMVAKGVLDDLKATKYVSKWDSRDLDMDQEYEEEADATGRYPLELYADNKVNFGDFYIDHPQEASAILLQFRGFSNGLDLANCTSW